MTSIDDLPCVALVIGAGASKEVWNGRSPKMATEGDWTPPLAADLFKFKTMPHYYKLAKDWPGAIELTQDLAGPNRENLALETELQRLAEHPADHVRQQFKDIPPYLRSLLLACEQRHVDMPLTYIRLFQQLLDETSHRLAIICLNYDTYVEAALSRRGHDRAKWYSKLRHYVTGPDPRARLCKPHGSTNWFVPFMTGHEEVTWRRALEATDLRGLRGEIEVRPDWADPEASSFTADGVHYYPAITAPLAGKDETHTICPSDQQDAVAMFLRQCSKTLVIGCSGRDANILKLLRDNLPTGNLVHLVLESAPSAQAVMERFRSGVPQMRNFRPIADGFREYAFGPGLREFARA